MALYHSMRLYDFHCNACGHDFEDLVRELSDARCPKCSTAEVEKTLSGFAIGGKSGETVSGGGGGGCAGGFCGGGACGLG